MDGRTDGRDAAAKRASFRFVGWMRRASPFASFRTPSWRSHVASNLGSSKGRRKAAANEYFSSGAAFIPLNVHSLLFSGVRLLPKAVSYGADIRAEFE